MNRQALFEKEEALCLPPFHCYCVIGTIAQMYVPLLTCSTLVTFFRILWGTDGNRCYASILTGFVFPSSLLSRHRQVWRNLQGQEVSSRELPRRHLRSSTTLLRSWRVALDQGDGWGSRGGGLHRRCRSIYNIRVRSVSAVDMITGSIIQRRLRCAACLARPGALLVQLRVTVDRIVDHIQAGSTTAAKTLDSCFFNAEAMST